MFPETDLQNLLFSVAYNMTGSAETAKDVVQDVSLKLLEKPLPQAVENPRSYILKTAINHCLNLRQQEARAAYKGPWLPGPPANQPTPDNSVARYETRNLLTYELAFLMERLTPTERAVFVLREAFDLPHAEIAEALDLSPENARQLLRRAKTKVAGLRHDAAPNEALAAAQKLVALISGGDLDGLISLFHDDIVLTGDGGGKAPALAKPLSGKPAVASFFIKLFHHSGIVPGFHFTQVLSQPAVLITVDGKLICAMTLSVSGNKIARIFNVLNPDKLTELEAEVARLATAER